MQSNEPSTNTTPKSDGSYVLETNQIDYRTLSKDEFADKIAHDFSTSNITFTVNRYSELTYFLKPAGTNQLIDADISFFDFGYEFANCILKFEGNFTYSFTKKESEEVVSEEDGGDQ